MIITCNECNTRFNIDESLLKETGLKVRCSKCKNVFLAYPSSLYEEQGKASEVETEAEIKLEMDDKDSSEISAGEEFESIELSADEASEEDTKVEKEPEESEPESGLDLELEIDETPAETEAEIEFEIDDKDSSEISGGEEFEDVELSADEASEEDTKVEKEPEESEPESGLDLEPEIDETPAETEAEIEFEIDDKDSSEISAEEEPEEESSTAFNMGALPDEQGAEKAIGPVDEAEKGALTEESEQPRVAAKTRISMPVLLLLLAALLISGAYGTYVLLDSVGINIPFVSDLLKPEVQDVGNLKIYASDINNKFVENSKIGKLLVITGKAKNGYSDARGYISITCKLYIKGKILSKTKTVYCGTVLSEPDLINMDLDAINNRLSNRFGDNKSNVKVKKGSIIPFMIVFADLPENLDEFTIEVAASFPS